MHSKNKIPLYGFNNLTKNLSLSLYKVDYLPAEETQTEYNKKINQLYNSSVLETCLIKVAQAIGGNVLNIASQDYSPQGSSVTLLISEEAKPESLVSHLDKSHICIHTYPEESPQASMAIFRADIELSTCGVISPLKILNYIIAEFSADVVDIDFRVRGMTRDTDGKKCFNDDKIHTLSDYLSESINKEYTTVDSSSEIYNVFHSRLMRKEVNLENQLFNKLISATICKNLLKIESYESLTEDKIKHKIQREIYELFNKEIS
jgi:S-adenosylmethionine decarboxylase